MGYNANDTRFFLGTGWVQPSFLLRVPRHHDTITLYACRVAPGRASIVRACAGLGVHLAWQAVL